MTSPDEPTSLRRVLAELAEGARPVDLAPRVARTRRRLHRQRAAATGLATVAVLGGGGFAWQHAPSGSGSHGLPLGGTTTTTPHPTATRSSEPSATGWFGYTPLPSVTRATGAGDAAVSTITSSTITSSTVTSGTITSSTVGSSAAASTSPAGATARPPSATPPGSPPPGHGCASPWTDESSGTGSPFASSAQREAAAAMGTALCGHLAASTVTLLTEWVTMGGVGHVGEGVTYDVQATRSAGSVYLAIWRGSERGSGSTPAVTSESGALRAQWPDGTVVLMTKGKDTAPNRAIVVDPAFDVFHG